jgi:hypothetical protein
MDGADVATRKAKTHPNQEKAHAVNGDISMNLQVR